MVMAAKLSALFAAHPPHIMTTYRKHPELESVAYAALDPHRLRENYLIGNFFVPGELHLTATHADRAMVGAAIPLKEPLSLDRSPSATRGGSLPLREWGIINIGGAGSIVVDGETHAMGPEDGLYIGAGESAVSFASDDASVPARYYIASYPSAQRHPNRHIAASDITPMELGSKETANERKISKYFEPGKVATSQLVMGLTKLASGSVWNTLPPHTHDRRSEVYLYYHLPADQAVFHFMGTPQASRHLVVRNEEAVVSPAWSMHFGCGTAPYRFIWCMGGENQDYTDMDPAPIAELQ
jgi:4-deoxy-L-threo-5-hexosulose-uronate ketol-isomerase